MDKAWLESSWREPEAFWSGLHLHWSRLQAGPGKSHTFNRYHFFQDALVAHASLSTPALAWFDGSEWRELSYAELQQEAEGLASAWEAAGVQAGEVLVVVHPIGPIWLAALFAGWRLGLAVSWLPPLGPAFMERRLQALAPQHLAIGPLYRRRLSSEWQDLALPLQPAPTPPTRAASGYRRDAVAAWCFDPTRLEPHLPIAVDAETLYLSALRDGMFTLGLRPGQSCAAPGWHSLEALPAMMLAVLLNGGTWVHVSLADVQKNPANLLARPIDALGVCRALRDILTVAVQRPEKPWRYWFRHPAESVDLMPWENFIQRMGLAESYVGNQIWNASMGGAVLFSARRRGRAHAEVLPAAGSCWRLGLVNAPELPSLQDSGRFALGRKEKDEIAWVSTPYLLAESRGRWLYLGCHPPGRAGRTYPGQEVLDVLSGHVRYRAVVQAPAPPDGDPAQVLLVFGEAIDEAVLKDRIAGELCAEFMPDRIEPLPLLPLRSADGGADASWCATHYPTGELYRRQRDSLHRSLSNLKRQVLGEL